MTATGRRLRDSASRRIVSASGSDAAWYGTWSALPSGCLPRSCPWVAADHGKPCLADAQAKFFRYWTCKEAWIKADGRGLSLPLVEFTVTGLDAGDCRVQRGGIALPWRVRPLVVREGYEAALASTDAPWSVGLYTVT